MTDNIHSSNTVAVVSEAGMDAKETIILTPPKCRKMSNTDNMSSHKTGLTVSEAGLDAKENTIHPRHVVEK